jgi:DNA-binding transcriptional LysR family regulator
MLDRYLLRYFLAVLDHGTFSRAAAHCGVSQPTLSVGIAKLERTLGSPLFFRSSRRVQLTDAGSRFLVHARRIEHEFNLAQQNMGNNSAPSPLRVGILHSFPGSVVAAAVGATPTGAKAGPIEILYGTERELVGHLARGRVDVALTLVGRGSDRFLEQSLFTEGYGLALSVHHPLAGRTQIAAEELGAEVMIVRRHCEALSETSRHFTERGVRPHFALRSTNDERVMQMVASGLGLTVMPEIYRDDGIARPRLSGFDMTRSIGFAFTHQAEPMKAEPPPFLRRLATAVRDAVERPSHSARD